MIGVKSTALKFGAKTKTWLWLFSVAAVVLFGLALLTARLQWISWVALIAVAFHLYWQIKAVNLDDPADCLTKFRANRWIGWMLLSGLIFGGIGLQGIKIGMFR